MKLQWVKIASGVWVDRSTFYCIRRRSAGEHGWIGFEDRDIYEAHETYPGCPVEVIGVQADLAHAKVDCQLHFDTSGMEEAA